MSAPESAELGVNSASSETRTDATYAKNRETATVRVGRSGVGTDFFPPGSHDASFHAADAMHPRTVVISAGGTVRFEISTFHTLAIYEPGTGPSDIDTGSLVDSGAPFEFPPLIDDSDGRIVNHPLVLPGPDPFVVFEHTFEEPGRYFFICAVLPHFAEGGMYGWVIVH